MAETLRSVPLATPNWPSLGNILASTSEPRPISIKQRIGGLADVWPLWGRDPRPHCPPCESSTPPFHIKNLLVKRGISAKIRKGQAPKSGLAFRSVLMVDLADRSGLITELSHTVYRRQFEESLRDRLKAAPASTGRS